MILEDATFEAYGYYPSALKPQSNNLIIAACETCGAFKITKKHSYYTFCTSCSQKGRVHTKEQKAKMSAFMKGKTNALGRTRSKETKALISKAKKGRTGLKGDKSPNYNGGKRMRNARKNAKRKRQLGYTLLMPLIEGEVGHHVTNEYVIGIPKEVHQKFSGGGRIKHRTKVLQWLKVNDKKKYLKVLCVLAKEV